MPAGMILRWTSAAMRRRWPANLQEARSPAPRRGGMDQLRRESREGRRNAGPGILASTWLDHPARCSIPQARCSGSCASLRLQAEQGSCRSAMPTPCRMQHRSGGKELGAAELPVTAGENRGSRCHSFRTIGGMGEESAGSFAGIMRLFDSHAQISGIAQAGRSTKPGQGDGHANYGFKRSGNFQRNGTSGRHRFAPVSWHGTAGGNEPSMQWLRGSRFVEVHRPYGLSD